MNATRLLCFVFLICSLACKHQSTSSVQANDRQCDKLVNQMIIAEKDFIAAVDSVRDLETARIAAEKIRGCANRLNAISGEFARLGPLSPSLRARQLKRLDMEDRRASTRNGTNVRVFAPEEDRIITPAADSFFEVWGTICTKSGLQYTPEEYRKGSAQPGTAPNAAPPHR